MYHFGGFGFAEPLGQTVHAFAAREGVMTALLRRFVREDSGEDLIEYGLLAAFVAAVATAVVIGDPLGISGSLKNAYQRAKTALDNS
jgi:Flp pilus assembly pilin Flp